MSITLEPDDNAQVIFETLDARGTPLLALDLVKNAVFQQAARQQAETDTLYEHVWQPQLDDPKRRSGSLRRGGILTGWMSSAPTNSRPAGRRICNVRQRRAAMGCWRGLRLAGACRMS